LQFFFKRFARVALSSLTIRRKILPNSKFFDIEICILFQNLSEEYRGL